MFAKFGLRKVVGDEVLYFKHNKEGDLVGMIQSSIFSVHCVSHSQPRAGNYFFKILETEKGSCKNFGGVTGE